MLTEPCYGTPLHSRMQGLQAPEGQGEILRSLLLVARYANVPSTSLLVVTDGDVEPKDYGKNC
jgi:hypothetical protein